MPHRSHQRFQNLDIFQAAAATGRVKTAWMTVSNSNAGPVPCRSVSPTRTCRARQSAQGWACNVCGLSAPKHRARKARYGNGSRPSAAQLGKRVTARGARKSSFPGPPLMAVSKLFVTVRSFTGGYYFSSSPGRGWCVRDTACLQALNSQIGLVEARVRLFTFRVASRAQRPKTNGIWHVHLSSTSVPTQRAK